MAKGLLTDMFEVRTGKESIDFRISSEARLVNSVVKESREFAQAMGWDDPSGLVVLLRELLTNAVHHGNGGVPSLTVTCSVQYLGDDCLRVEVEDEGNGFDYESLDMSLPDNPKHTADRGYTLINAVSDSLEFNDRGNRIVAYINAKGKKT